MLVSLLSSPLLTATHEHLIWIVGSLSSSGINCPSSTENNNSSSSSPSRSKNNSAATAAAAEVTKAMKSGTSGSNANANSVDASVSMPAASAAADLDDDSNHKEKSSSSASARDAILAAGAMPPLLKILESDPHNLPLQRIGAWCLSSMVEGRYTNSSNDSSSSSGGSAPKRKYPDAEDVDILSLLTTLRRMLQITDDEEILGFTCWALSHLCDGPAYHIAAVIYETGWTSDSLTPTVPENGIIPRLVELLSHPSPKVAKPALRSIGNCVCAECSAPDNDQQGRGSSMPVVDYTEVVLGYDAVPRLRELIDHEHREIQKEACWTLSNIAAGTPSQIQAVIDSGAIPPLVNLVNNENTDKEVRSEACWVVLNATSCGNDEQIDVLINAGCVSVLGVLLTEASMVMMALEGLERVLQMEGNRDSNDDDSGEEGTGHQTIVKCAELIKTVIDSPHHSSAVLKRAKRVWGTHVVECALCEKYYSAKLLETHWCSECKCHVCRRCNCAVYHLSYQEELWAEDEGKQEAKKNAKKSKKAKKKEKEKAKKEKKRLETQQQAAPMPPTKAKTKDDDGKSGSNSNESSGKAMSSSRGSIDDDTECYGMDGGDAVQDEIEVSSGQPPIDLVSYLQQTGSIIALAKLMDSLYESDDDDEVANEQPNVDVKQRALATQ